MGPGALSRGFSPDRSNFLGRTWPLDCDEFFRRAHGTMTRAVKKEPSREEFERFVAASASDLLRTGYLIVWDLAAAEDLVQECLFQIAKRWPRVRAMEYPAAYARRILVNQALAGAKRRNRHWAELDGDRRRPRGEPNDDAAERALGLVETTSELVDALRTLAPQQRAVLGLRYFDDLSEAQVAEILGCSVGTVKSTTSRALDRLRQAATVVAAAPTHP
jgi:RNA polymerase sigma-70 factor (sigma-E family)